jgi:hypothetical protein
MRLSPFLQEKLVLLGSDDVFGHVPVLVESVLGVCVSESSVYRSCCAASDAIDGVAVAMPSESLQSSLEEASSTVCGMVDGSMLLTDGGWQETKLGRVFPQGEEPGQWATDSSEYVAERGHYGGFVEQFERLLPPASPCRKVFVTDGAPWIGNWLSGSYPDAVQILDFFHLREHISDAFKEVHEGKYMSEWAMEQFRLGNGQAVESFVRDCDGIAEKMRLSLLGYLANNRYRTDYASYLKEGYPIGSGAIEAAHRSVLQSRMKRSGQRWSDDGCDRMVKLRVIRKSRKHSLIRSLFTKSAA